jgi:hypothetical protein
VPRRRRIQFLAEVAFLGGLAALAGLAHMRAAAVVGVMAFGWVVVALIEWSTWLDRPHFGRGLPPRYFTPQVSLPPPEPLARAPLGSQPAGRLGEGAETWVAAPDWAEAFGEWPLVDPARLGEDTGMAAAEAPAADTIVAQALERPEVSDPTELTELTELTKPPWIPAAPSPPEVGRDVPLPALAGDGPGLGDDQPTDEALALPLGRIPEGAPLARHRVDPFAPSPGGRLRRRRDGEGVIELPAAPPSDRPPPLSARTWRAPEQG